MGDSLWKCFYNMWLLTHTETSTTITFMESMSAYTPPVHDDTVAYPCLKLPAGLEGETSTCI